MPDIDDYQLTRVIARGGMGVVHEAVERATGRHVALKRLLPGVDAEVASRFLVEARGLARLDHPAIVRVHTFGQDRSGPFMVMDLVEGESLQRELDRAGPLAPERAMALADALAAALEHAHQRGVLHRDLKPSNVLVDLAGRARLIDFGLARLRPGGGSLAHLTRTGEVLGTPAYMSPEQADGRPVDERTDVYGLGALLYALLTGAPPFAGGSPIAVLNAVLTREASPPSQLRPGLPSAVDAIVLACLAKDVTHRPASMRELRRLLREGPPAPARGGARTARMVGVALALALAGTGAGAWALLDRPRVEPTPAPPVAVLVEESRPASVADPELERARQDVRGVLDRIRAHAWPPFRDPDHAEAMITRCDRLLGVDRDDVAARLVRAAAVVTVRTPGDPLPDVERVLELDPSDSHALTVRALVRFEQSDAAGAASDVKEVLSRDPDHAFALAVRGQLRANQADLGRAEADVDRAIALAPDMALAHLLRAQILMARDPEGARAAVDRAIALTPIELAYLHRATLRRRDDPAGAIDDYVRAAELTRSDELAASWLDHADDLEPSSEQARRMAELRARLATR